MKKNILSLVLLFGLFVFHSSCHTADEQSTEKASENEKTTETPDFTGLTVNKIEFGKDGYMAYLTDDQGDKFSMIVSIPNMEKNYVKLEIGDRINVNGELTEGLPNHILPKEISVIK